MTSLLRGCKGRLSTSITLFLVLGCVGSAIRLDAGDPRSVAGIARDGAVWTPEREVFPLGKNHQEHAVAVTTDAGRIVVWDEAGDDNSRLIRATGLTRDLEPLASTVISSPPTYSRFPSGASNGSVVLLIWYEKPQESPPRLVGRRFTSTLVPLDPVPFPISTWSTTLAELGFPYSTGYPLSRPGLVWNGRYFLAAWNGPDLSIRLARITAEGVVLDPEPRRITSARGLPPPPLFLPSLASAGTTTLLAFQDSYYESCHITCPVPPPPPRIEALRLDTEGAPIDPFSIVVSTAVGVSPRVASDGSQFLVTWMGAGVEAARISTAGVVLDVPAIQFGPLYYNTATTPEVSHAKGGFVVTWSDDELFVRFISWSGAVLEATLIASDPTILQYYPSAGSDGSLVVFYGRGNGMSDGILRTYFRALPATPRKRGAIRGR